MFSGCISHCLPYLGWQSRLGYTTQSSFPFFQRVGVSRARDEKVISGINRESGRFSIEMVHTNIYSPFLAYELLSSVTQCTVQVLASMITPFLTRQLMHLGLKTQCTNTDFPQLCVVGGLLSTLCTHKFLACLPFLPYPKVHFVHVFVFDSLTWFE